jgi:hypothetical protein
VHFASLAENSLGTENATYQYGFEVGIEVLLLDQIDTTRCEVHTAVYILMMVFLDMTRCSLRDNRFRRNMLMAGDDYNEDGDSRFFRHICAHLPDYKAPYLIRP